MQLMSKFKISLGAGHMDARVDPPLHCLEEQRYNTNSIRTGRPVILRASPQRFMILEYRKSAVFLP